MVTQFLGAWEFTSTSKAGERVALLPDVFVSLLAPVQLGECRVAFELVDGLDVAAELAFLFEDEVGAARKFAVAANGSGRIVFDVPPAVGGGEGG